MDKPVSLKKLQAEFGMTRQGLDSMVSRARGAFPQNFVLVEVEVKTGKFVRKQKALSGSDAATLRRLRKFNHRG